MIIPNIWKKHVPNHQPAMFFNLVCLKDAFQNWHVLICLIVTPPLKPRFSWCLSPISIPSAGIEQVARDHWRCLSLVLRHFQSWDPDLRHGPNTGVTFTADSVTANRGECVCWWNPTWKTPGWWYVVFTNPPYTKVISTSPFCTIER